MADNLKKRGGAFGLPPPGIAPQMPTLQTYLLNIRRLGPPAIVCLSAKSELSGDTFAEALLVPDVGDTFVFKFSAKHEEEQVMLDIARAAVEDHARRLAEALPRDLRCDMLDFRPFDSKVIGARRSLGQYRGIVAAATLASTDEAQGFFGSIPKAAIHRFTAD